ncbi:MAG: HNH endonuclease [Candidatus Omnitrophica bacterium]|nr:HNH endonuclease [Candidatus Omnitrophota bacterium]
MNRKQFIKSHGATCNNWTWSWSFVNHDERFVVFGAWDRFTEGRKDMILTEAWSINRKGRKSPSYNQSREHLRLIEENGFRLFTFPMEYSEELEGEDGTGPGKIGGFTPKLRERTLTRVGSCWYAGDTDANAPLPEEVPDRGSYSEGAKRIVTINAYERSATARAACIANHGLACSVCGFDFERTYGELGAGFIHVHHIVPIASIGDKYVVDPIADLVPVCPNCHAMIHRVEPPLTISQLKEHLMLSLCLPTRVVPSVSRESP